MQDGNNPCSLYFLNILLDTTLGIGILYGLLHALFFTCQHVLGWSGFVSGEYSAPMRHGRIASMLECWVRQTAVYVLALVLMKLIVLGLLYMMPFLTLFGSWLLGLFQTHRAMQVIFVMALFPMAMNMLQFWIVDSMLLYQRPPPGYEPAPPVETARP